MNVCLGVHLYVEYIVCDELNFELPKLCMCALRALLLSHSGGLAPVES